MAFVLWLLFDVVFSTILEILFEITKTFDSDRDLRILAVFWLSLLGIGGGLLTGIVAPARILDPGPFPGVSLLLVPLLLGTVMQAWGYVAARRATDVSHLATWYGGATLGLGLAAGRLIVVAFIRDVRAV